MTDADPDIRELDPRTVERIAAGEVVERPASVVKELIENAVDADASRIDVAVEAGGTESISVADDGVGMSESAVRRAVEEHTTSKIADIADLEGGVGTLGFRGEALHAIGAVSRLTIRTRPRGGDRGTELVVEGGEVTDVSPAGCPEGTTVEVTDLFYNVPARRKYLGQPATEFARVNRVVTGYALADPDVAVSLAHGDRETFATTGGGDLRAAVLSVYGREVARAMIPVDPGELPEGPLSGVSGLVSHPETTRASRDYLNTYINGRYVTASAVREAIVDAYDAQLAPDRNPFAVLYCGLDPATVDVNVHPRKLEVRFADEAGLRDQVEAAVSAALMREGLLRSGAPRGKSSPDQATIQPGDVADGRVGGSADASSAGETAGSDAGSAGPTADDEPAAETADASAAASADRTLDRADDGSSPGSTPDGADGRRDAERKFLPATAQERLGDGEAQEGGVESFERLPAMRILGQLRDTYVVAETDDGLVLVDQHAADERINYERLRRTVGADGASQALAEPVTVELTAGEAALANERRAALERVGFDVEQVDDRRVRVAAVPAAIAAAADADLVREVVGDLVAGERAAASTVEAAADDLLADLACYPSITGNTSLTEGSVSDLLARLDDCENPWACPHGRPVVIEFDDDEIESRFERDYPGHG